MAAEDDRARAYQMDRRRQDEHQRSLAARLAGSEAAAQALRDRWEPVTRTLEERRNGTEPDVSVPGNR